LKRVSKPLLAVAMGMMATVSIAGIADAENGRVNLPIVNLELHSSAGFTPKAVSKTQPTPGVLNVSWEAATLDGTHSAALREFVFEADRDMSFDLKGYPTCGLMQQVEPQWPIPIRCRDARIGEGRVNLTIAFPEQEEMALSSRMLIFNGSERDGVPTIDAYFEITEPTPAALMIIGTVRRTDTGRYGTEVVFSIPKIAGGSGSVTSFEATIGKEYVYKGKRHSVVSLKCPDDKTLFHDEAIFSDGTWFPADIVRTCIGKAD
jgi:hypothetical protein